MPSPNASIFLRGEQFPKDVASEMGGERRREPVTDPPEALVQAPGELIVVREALQQRSLAHRQSPVLLGMDVPPTRRVARVGLLPRIGCAQRVDCANCATPSCRAHAASGALSLDYFGTPSVPFFRVLRRCRASCACREQGRELG